MEDGGVPRKKRGTKQIDKFKGSIRGPLRLRASVPKKHQEGNRTLYPSITLNQREFNKTQDFPENVFYTTKYEPTKHNNQVTHFPPLISAFLPSIYVIQRKEVIDILKS
jgi:hypothetical protein